MKIGLFFLKQLRLVFPADSRQKFTELPYSVYFKLPGSFEIHWLRLSKCDFFNKGPVNIYDRKTQKQLVRQTCKYFPYFYHYTDVIMGTVVSQITSLTIVYSIVYSDADHRKHQNSASLAFVRGIHRGPVNSPHKWPVTRKMFPFDDVIMIDIFDNEVIQKDGRWQSYENVFNLHNKNMHNKILVKFSGRNLKDAEYHQRTSSETWIVNCRVSIKHGPVY